VTDDNRFNDPRQVLPHWWRQQIDQLKTLREHAHQLGLLRVRLPPALNLHFPTKRVRELIATITKVRKNRRALQDNLAALTETERNLQAELDRERGVGAWRPPAVPAPAPPEPAPEPAPTTAEQPNEQSGEPTEQTSEPADEPQATDAAESDTGEPTIAILRRLKLGDDYQRVQGTSLRSAKEMDALVHLKEHRPGIASTLIERVVSGETASAVAVVEKLKDGRHQEVCEEFAEPAPEQDRPESLSVRTRKLRLGDDYDRLRSTSLGSPKEMDELIRLKDALMRERLEDSPDWFKALVERAVAGEAISATALIEKMKNGGGLRAVLEEFERPSAKDDPRAVWAKEKVAQLLKDKVITRNTEQKAVAKILEGESKKPVESGGLSKPLDWKTIANHARDWGWWPISQKTIS
jgi:hypothetical protein